MKEDGEDGEVGDDDDDGGVNDDNYSRISCEY